MASHPQPTDIGHVWTLSRDRTLRLWTAKSGCVSAKTLPLTSLERALSLVPGTATSDSNPNVLLEAEPQRLLRVFSISLSPEKEQHFVLAFSPHRHHHNLEDSFSFSALMQTIYTPLELYSAQMQVRTAIYKILWSSMETYYMFCGTGRVSQTSRRWH